MSLFLVVPALVGIGFLLVLFSFKIRTRWCLHCGVMLRCLGCSATPGRPGPHRAGSAQRRAPAAQPTYLARLPRTDGYRAGRRPPGTGRLGNPPAVAAVPQDRGALGARRHDRGGYPWRTAAAPDPARTPA